MAKKQTAPDASATPPAGADNSGGKNTEAAPKKAGRPQGQSTKGNDVFVSAGEFPTDTNSKIAPQALAIANIVKAAPDGRITRDELVKAMDGIVQTRQPQARILSYYQKALVEKGYLTIETPAPAPKKEETAAAPEAQTAGAQG